MFPTRDTGVFIDSPRFLARYVTPRNKKGINRLFGAIDTLSFLFFRFYLFLDPTDFALVVVAFVDLEKAHNDYADAPSEQKPEKKP